MQSCPLGSRTSRPHYRPHCDATGTVAFPDADHCSLTTDPSYLCTLHLTLRRKQSSFPPLPLVYNLRSSVGEGVTTIRWSANPSEVADCVFGVWYAPDSPVDVTRPPDTTVWYSNTMTEYQTSFQQNVPAYVAVAPIRTGNQTELGIVKELYLDWNNTPPRAPDDVMLLNIPLPAIDPTITERSTEDANVSLWF